MNKCAKLHEDSLSSKKVKFNLSSAIELSETADFVYNFVQNPWQASNFGGAFDQLFLWTYLCAFTEDASQILLYHGAKKSKNDQNHNSFFKTLGINKLFSPIFVLEWHSVYKKVSLQTICSQWCVRFERGTTLQEVCGLKKVKVSFQILFSFSTDKDRRTVSSSIFVGAEREENLIGMIPTRASLRIKVSYLTSVAKQAKTAFLHGPTVWKSPIVGIEPATFRSESAALTTAPRKA